MVAKLTVVTGLLAPILLHFAAADICPNGNGTAFAGSKDSRKYQALCGQDADGYTAIGDRQSALSDVDCLNLCDGVSNCVACSYYPGNEQCALAAAGADPGSYTYPSSIYGADSFVLGGYLYHNPVASSSSSSYLSSATSFSSRSLSSSVSSIMRSTSKI